ncbi:MAG TPA: hypothetical protein DCG38_01035 [Eubacteriaceae bacterium]|nr:hypothetical protein [Eubacteriaceae bacterium]
MIERFLINKFVNKDQETIKLRESYGKMSSVTGIVCNMGLFAAKLVLGLISGSISLVADSINNLSDVGTNIVTLVGFKMSVKPADKEHPFGHGRTEYISAFAVSFVILLLGYELLKTSFERIINPVEVNINLMSGIIILLTIGVKIWLAKFYMRISRKINSQALEAASIDSRNDVLATSTVLLSFIIIWISGINIDGFIGLIVAAFIIYNGIQFVKEAMDTLIGVQPDGALIESIHDYIEEFDGVMSLHDVIVHDYGPVSKMASAHVEISADFSLVVAHEIVDRIERDIYEDMGISLVVHIDPVEDDCETSSQIKDDIEAYLGDDAKIKGIHDFRILPKENVVIFDLFLPEDFDEDTDRVRAKMVKNLKEKYDYKFLINIRKEKHYM